MVLIASEISNYLLLTYIGNPPVRVSNASLVYPPPRLVPATGGYYGTYTHTVATKASCSPAQWLMTTMFSLGGSLLAADDVRGAVLQEVDAAALCQLKAVSVEWRARARRELCNRLCRREGQPEPTGLASITDLDVEGLALTGRPWEVVVAGRELPQLARLHGFGFVVDVHAVREADLAPKADDVAQLGGTALRRCIRGEGDPPSELLFAAVACAACGTVCGVPVQELREDNAIGSVDLDRGGAVWRDRLGVIGAVLLGLMLPALRSVRSLRCRSDHARG